MKRYAYNELLAWKLRSDRKPLIIRGARQVGKTWLMEHFAQNEYSDYIYINFEKDKQLKNLFVEDYDVNRILSILQIHSKIKPKPNETLIIFDEIQSVDGGLTSLKYFYEDAPQYHIMAAGSLLGIAIHKNISFPVGKVNFIDVYPLSFFEFLEATGNEDYQEAIINKQWSVISSLKSKYLELLKYYYFIGGMPAAVQSYIDQRDFVKVRTVQNEILDTYENDFSKHAPIEIVPRIRMLWDSIPIQLSKENKKFTYSHIKQGARAKDFELALEWLIDCGLVHKLNRVSKPGIPLKSYVDLSAFKLFFNDTGLLLAKVNTDIDVIIDNVKIFEEFKGALTEQYVFQQLIQNKNITLCYWSSEKSDGEIDMLLQFSKYIVPVEIKASENLQAKSLRAFYNKYGFFSVKTSMSDFRKEEWLVNIPLYAISEIKEIYTKI
ncbi:MAG: ATP-binding protein [Prevotellaceae bacterium]|jgi:predicted AAA+ superfamily ATPase|nr:ATP-binding protein [Prevotellaceae bacterium]